MLINPFHFCRILRIPYQALKLLQICGSTTCLPAVQLLLQMWLGWSMTLLLSACLVLKCKHNSLSKLLSSPRPKGERASRARAVTVSQCPHSALCCYPNVKVEIRDSSQIRTTALIFLKSNYFRQKYLEIPSCAVSLFIYIWV